jgi:hypothetical protein
MALIDQLLNLIGLVLWLSWHGDGQPSQIRGAGTLLSNLKPVETRRARRWLYPLMLVVLLVARPLLYAPLAPVLDWTPTLSPGPVSLAFRADDPKRLLAFSFLSFAWCLLLFRAGILLLAALGRREGDPAGLSRWVRELAGRAAQWPVAAVLVVPVLTLAVSWVIITLGLRQIGVLPPDPLTAGRLLAQSVVVGLAVWLPMRWLLAGLLVLRLVHDYVYLGEHSLWEFVRSTGGRLLRPLEWLPARLGRFDSSPLIGAAVVLAATEGLELLLIEAYRWLGR